MLNEQSEVPDMRLFRQRQRQWRVEVFLTRHFCRVCGKRAGLKRRGEVSPDNKAQ